MGSLDNGISRVTADAGTNLNTSLLALEAGGNLAAIKADTDKIPSQGQAVAAFSTPVVLPAAQITTLTPPTSVTVTQGTGTNLHTVVDSGTVTANAGTGTFAVSAASLPLPALAATSTKQSDGSQKTQIVDGSGNVIAATANALNVNIASATSITTGPGYNAPAAGTITTGSGAGATVSLTCQQYTSIVADLTGTFSGTVIFEQQFQGSGTWYRCNGSPVLSTQSPAVSSAVLAGSPITPVSYQFTVGVAIGFRVTVLASEGGSYTSGTLNVFLAETTDNLQYGQSIAISNTPSVSLSAETTKVIGVVREADGSGNLLTSTSNALDVNLKTSSITVTTQGGKTNNNAAPGATNVGVLPALANAAQQSWTEGNQVALSVNLKGSQRSILQDAAGNDRGVNVNASNQASVSLDGITGITPYFANAIKTTVTVSAAAGRFHGTYLINTDSAPVYLQVFDTTGAVTLGTTVPTFVIPFSANATAANGSSDRGEITIGIAITNGIKAAATTTATGSSTSGNGLTGMITYK